MVSAVPAKQTFYDILGVSPEASGDVIRQAFRQRAKERHPDKAAGSEAAMRLLNEAYETLRDAQRRQGYDRLLTQPGAKSKRQPPPPPLDPDVFWTRVWRPLDRDVVSALRDVYAALDELAEDPTDDERVTAFDLAIAVVNAALTKALNLMASLTWPPALAKGLGDYRDGLREAVTAVEDLGDYSLAFDDSLLGDGEERLQEADRLLAKVRSQQRGRSAR